MTKRLLVAILFTFSSQPVFSADFFNIEITSPDSADTYTETFSEFDNFVRGIKQKNITLEGYTQNSEATIAIQLGNTPASISYEAGGTDLTFSANQCGINRTFSGTSRAVSENNFSDYLKDNEEDVLGKLSNCFLKDNPLDPVAVSIRDLVDFGPTFTQSTAESQQERFSVGLVAGHFSSGDQSNTILTLPLSYTHYFEEEGRKLRFTTPISYLKINGSTAYSGSMGVAYTRPINGNWTVIPAAKIGLTASNDLATGAATVASALLTNKYEFYYGRSHVALANMVGLISSIDLDIGDLESYYDFQNQVVKNGIAVEFPQRFNMFGGKTSIQASVANTLFFGDRISVDNYTDIAISFGTRRKLEGKDNTQDSIHLGLTYTLGNNNYKGGKINFGYEF